MKLCTAFLCVFLSSTLLGQLDKVSQIQVTDSTIIINNSTLLSYPMDVEDLIALFGKARCSDSPKSSNLVYFWDNLGLMAFTLKGSVEITSFEICLSRSSIGPNSRRKFHGILIIANSVVTKKSTISDLNNLGFDTRKSDDILPSWHSLELDRLKVIIETERKDKRTTGIGISKRW